MSPIVVGGKSIVAASEYSVVKLLEPRRGIPFRPLALQLSFVKQEKFWGMYFRSGLVQLAQADSMVLGAALGVGDHAEEWQAFG